MYAGQEITVRTRRGTTDWFQIGKGVHPGYILSLCLSNFYAEYIMPNAVLDETQAGIKIARKNINNVRNTQMTPPLWQGLLKKESEKVGLKLNIQKSVMAFGPITSWQIDGETVETVADFIFLGSEITAVGDC